MGLSRLAVLGGELARLATGEVCATLLQRMEPASGFEDDVAVAAIMPTGETGASFVDTILAEVGQIPAARHRLQAWLEGVGLAGEEAFAVLMAVGEAVNNGIDHGASGGAAGWLALEAFLREPGLVATVSDPGVWSKDSAASRRSSDRGRGLDIMHALSDGLTIDRSPSGTRVTLSFRTAVAVAAPKSAPAEFELRQRDGPEAAAGLGCPLYELWGEVDTTNAARLGEEASGLPHPLLLDLSPAHHLDSAGFAALDRLLVQGGLDLVVAPWSVLYRMAQVTGLRASQSVAGAGARGRA